MVPSDPESPCDTPMHLRVSCAHSVRLLSKLRPKLQHDSWSPASGPKNVVYIAPISTQHGDIYYLLYVQVRTSTSTVMRRHLR